MHSVIISPSMDLSRINFNSAGESGAFTTILRPSFNLFFKSRIAGDHCIGLLHARRMLNKRMASRIQNTRLIEVRPIAQKRDDNDVLGILIGVRNNHPKMIV